MECDIDSKIKKGHPCPDFFSSRNPLRIDTRIPTFGITESNSDRAQDTGGEDIWGPTIRFKCQGLGVG